MVASTPSVYLGWKFMMFPTGGIIFVWMSATPGPLLLKIDSSWGLPLG
jgi:hypothetical protein